MVASYVTNFKLYDVTRRALNCLTLLLDEATESLMPEIIDCYQHRLVQAIVSVSQIPTSEPDCTKIGKPRPDDVNKAVKILGNQVVRFLKSWDSFLRESYYVETNPQNNEIAPVSWSIKSLGSTLTGGGHGLCKKSKDLYTAVSARGNVTHPDLREANYPRHT